MRREREAYLWDILDAIVAVEVFVQNASTDQQWARDLLQTAIERKLEIIGEAIKQMEARFPGSSARLPEVKLAVGMRNWLAHGYFAIESAVLWSTVSEKLPALKTSVQQVLAEAGSNEKT